MAESQPPEGLRQIAREAAALPPCRHWLDVGETKTCVNCITDAVLAALFDACEVREDFPMTYTTRNGLERTVPHMVREGAVVNARSYAQDGFVPARVEHRWTLRYSQPVMRIDGEPVSSTGEEPTGG